jgi:hypothetical protein
MRSKYDPSNLHCRRHKKDESRRGEGSSLSFDCVLATLKPNTLCYTSHSRDRLWISTCRAVLLVFVNKYSNSEET